MRIEDLHIGMKVRHPNHGVGEVTGLSPQIAEISFDTGTRSLAPETSELEPEGERVSVQSLEMPLDQFIRNILDETINSMNLKEPDTVVEDLGERWRNGTVILKPANPELQAKEIPLETFFHKIVMIRNNLRVLEQRVNSHKVMTDADKFDLQQYITRSYGSMTTFNVLFKNKEDQFRSGN